MCLKKGTDSHPALRATHRMTVAICHKKSWQLPAFFIFRLITNLIYQMQLYMLDLQSHLLPLNHLHDLIAFDNL